MEAEVRIERVLDEGGEHAGEAGQQARENPHRLGRASDVDSRNGREGAVVSHRAHDASNRRQREEETYGDDRRRGSCNRDHLRLGKTHVAEHEHAIRVDTIRARLWTGAEQQRLPQHEREPDRREEQAHEPRTTNA